MATHFLTFRWTALRSLLLLAVLHRLNCLAFLAACAPVLLLTAFLLGVVLVHGDVPLEEDEVDGHLYKKIRPQRIIVISDHEEPFSSSCGASSVEEEEEEEEEEEHLVEEEEEEEVVVKAAVAWTADDERSIQSIGSLELERDARLEKLMSRRLQPRNLIDLDIHIPARNNPYNDNDPGSAPSSSLLLLRNPFGIQRGPEEMMLTRHGSFAAPAASRASRFRPYFVANDKTMLLERACSDNSNSKKSSSSSSSTSSTSSDHQKQQQIPINKEVQQQQEEEAAQPSKWDGNRNGMAVDVELISDSSDDDMSLPGDEATISVAVEEAREHSDEDDSFEVASITQQVVAAGHQQQQLRMRDKAQPQMTAGPGYASGPPPPSGHQQQEEGVVLMEEKETREVSEIREHPVLGPVPVVDDSSSSSPASEGAAGPGAETGASAGAAGGGAGAVAGAGAAGAGAGAATTGSSSGGKSSIKFKAPSKKAVFGFFRK